MRVETGRTRMSARRRRTTYTADARQELSDILLYTGREWGRAQRDAYRSLIRSTIRTLAFQPDMGRPRDELATGLKSHPVGSHMIFYWVHDHELVIAHILHNRRDVECLDWRLPED